MLLSIIIPVYNTGGFLKQCLKSVVRQQFKDYEIVIVDNNSTDNSLAVAEEFAKKYSFIKIIRHKENKGLLQSRITGVKNAEGQYIMNIDSDDYLMDSEVLTKLSSAIKKTNADIIQYGVSTDHDWGGWFSPLSLTLLTSPDEIKALYFSDEMRCSTLWSRLVKRELYLRIISRLPNDLSVTFSEDFLQTPLLMNAAQSYYAVEDPLYYYRVHKNGTQQSWTVSKLQDLIMSDKLILDILEQRLPQKYYFTIRKRLCFDVVHSILNMPQNTISGNFLGLLMDAFSADYVICFIFSLELDKQTKLFSMIQWKTSSFAIQNRKKIALMTNNLYFGGGERADTSLLQEFYKRGYDVTLFTMEDPNTRDFKYPAGIKRIKVTTDLNMIFQECQRIVCTYDIDVFIIHDHHTIKSYSYMFFLKFLGKKIIVMNHVDLFIYAKFNDRPVYCNRSSIFRILYSNVDAVTCLLSYNVDYLRLSGIDKAVLLSNPVSSSLQDINCSSRDSNTIVWCGRWDALKNPLDALEAFHLASQKLKNIRLVMLGDGLLKSEVERYIADYNLKDKVIMPGFVDPTPYYQKAALHVFTSETEAFAMVLAETKNFGIATLMYELPDISLHSTAGLITVPQKDTTQLAAQLINLMSDQLRLKELGQQARKSLEEFSTENTMNRWDNLIDAVCSDTLLENKELLPDISMERAKKVVQELNNKYILFYREEKRSEERVVLSRNQMRWLRLFDVTKAWFCKMPRFKSFLKRSGKILIFFRDRLGVKNETN